MQYTIEKSQGVPVVIMRGDLWGGPELCGLQSQIKDEVIRLISEGERQFVLDLTASRRINSIGIGVLVALHVSIQNAGGELKICSVDHRPQAALETTGLGGLFDIHPSREDAITALKAPV